MNVRLPGLLTVIALLAWSIWLLGALAPGLPATEQQLLLNAAAKTLLITQGLLLALLIPALPASADRWDHLFTPAWLALVPLPIHSILWLMGVTSLAFLGGTVVSIIAFSYLALAGTVAIRAIPDQRWRAMLTPALQLALCLGLLPALLLAGDYLPT